MNAPFAKAIVNKETGVAYLLTQHGDVWRVTMQFGGNYEGPIMEHISVGSGAWPREAVDWDHAHDARREERG